MKVPCEVVKDLLPLYCDGVCSQESKSLVEEHLEKCEACREEYQKLREDEMALAQAGEEEKRLEALRQVKKKLRIKRAVAAALAVVVFAIACTGAGVWMNSATIDVDGEGLIERVEYDPTPPEWTKEPDAAESGLTQEQVDHYGGQLKIYFNEDHPTGITYGVFPVKIGGETRTAMIASIRQTVWDCLTCWPEESWGGHPFDVDVGGPAWPHLFSEDVNRIDWSYRGENGYYYVNQGFYTKEELEAMRLDECVVDALYYLPYSAFKDFYEISPEETTKIMEEKATLLWEKEE